MAKKSKVSWKDLGILGLSAGLSFLGTMLVVNSNLVKEDKKKNSGNSDDESLIPVTLAGAATAGSILLFPKIPQKYLAFGVVAGSTITTVLEVAKLSSVRKNLPDSVNNALFAGDDDLDGSLTMTKEQFEDLVDAHALKQVSDAISQQKLLSQRSVVNGETVGSDDDTIEVVDGDADGYISFAREMNGDSDDAFSSMS